MSYAELEQASNRIFKEQQLVEYRGDKVRITKLGETVLMGLMLIAPADAFAVGLLGRAQMAVMRDNAIKNN